MKNLKILFVSFVLVLSFSLCSCKDECKFVEYNWIDTSNIALYDSTYGEGFSKDDGCTKITTNGTYNASSQKYKVVNWMLSYDTENDGKNRQISNVYGFETKVKSSFSDGAAGIQWLNEKNYDFYYFKISGNGTFEIKSSIGSESKTICKFSSAESGIKINEFNTIKVKSQSNEDISVYINEKQVFKIAAEDLQIIPGRLAYAYSCKSSGNAWIQLLSYQKIKH